MTRRLIDCVKHSNLELAHHRAFWEAAQKYIPAGALENSGELGSIWNAAVPSKPAAWLTPARTIVREFEGCRLQAYKCPAGVWTVGWGQTTINGRPVQQGDTITQQQADAFLDAELQGTGEQLLKLLPMAATWRANEIAALISWAFNVGLGAVVSSTLRKRLQAGEPPSVVIQQELPKWCHAGEAVLPGLERRRAAEVALFNNSKPVVQQQPARLTPSSDFGTRITPHIQLGEFALWQEARRFDHQHQLDTAAELAAFLERVRVQFGNKAVVITSGYRPPAINRSVNGASRSEHLYDAPSTGAVDFNVPGADIKAVQAWCDQHWPFSVGYGAPKGFVHLGIRPGRPRVRWDY